MKKLIILLLAALCIKGLSAQNIGSEVSIDDERPISYLLVDEKPELKVDGIENSMDYILSLINWPN